jgi:hypothetical protein
MPFYINVKTIPAKFRIEMTVLQCDMGPCNTFDISDES